MLLAGRHGPLEIRFRRHCQEWLLKTLLFISSAKLPCQRWWHGLAERCGVEQCGLRLAAEVEEAPSEDQPNPRQELTSLHATCEWIALHYN